MVILKKKKGGTEVGRDEWREGREGKDGGGEGRREGRTEGGRKGWTEGGRDGGRNGGGREGRTDGALCNLLGQFVLTGCINAQCDTVC